MTHKNFDTVAGTIFGIIAIVHILRLINGWHVTVGNTAVPLWISALAAVVAGYLALQAFRLSK